MSVAENVVRMGIIGTGRVGRNRMKAYAGIDGAKIVACADLNEAEGRRAAETYGVAHVYTSFRHLLARDDIDAVDVCLHNNFHMPVTVAALAAGKHVHCEKAMAGSYRDGEAMLAAALAQGELGALHHVRSTGFRGRGRPNIGVSARDRLMQERQSAGGALYHIGKH